MATIGIVDWDLIQWEQPIVFNLELMKIITDLRNQNHVVQMIKKIDTSKYSKIILFKNYDDGIYPSEVFNNPKIEVRGLTSTGGIYIPNDEKIESRTPDTSAYETMSKYYQCSDNAQRDFNSMLVGTHVRFSLDGRTIWDNWRSQLDFKKDIKRTTLYIHDENILKVEGAYEVIVSFMEKMAYNRRLAFKHPLIIETKEQFRRWGVFPKATTMSEMRLNFVPDDEDVIKLSRRQTISYVLDYSTFIQRAHDIYRHSMFYREHNVVLLLKITYKGENQVIKNFLFLMEEFISRNNKRGSKNTMVWFCKSGKSIFLKRDLYDIFFYVREANPELFRLFYEMLSFEIENNKITSRYITSGCNNFKKEERR